ncbi:hypothetical protein FHS23_002185 [Prauserella isguenensis]|uniref:DUF218 domain-containing protein n=1 Tax=Prauserella isguenensis TaxID=1470180 RepID=A0A839S198_9PSEU|nr:hypothetical protein [Prauserella isguenensis]
MTDPHRRDALAADSGAGWPAAVRADVGTLWHFHRIDDPLQPVDVAVGLGSHDADVAVHTAALYHRGLFPLIVFTGATTPTTAGRFPRGEAVHFREIALRHGVPTDAVRIETEATSTVGNIDNTRVLLAAEGRTPRSVLLVSRPYQQRRAQAVAAARWPDVHVRCTGAEQDLDTYLASVGDPDRVAAMLVGDTQRLALQGRSGEIAPQDIPGDVRRAYERLVAAGYTGRLITPATTTARPGATRGRSPETGRDPPAPLARCEPRADAGHRVRPAPAPAYGSDSSGSRARNDTASTLSVRRRTLTGESYLTSHVHQNGM